MRALRHNECVIMRHFAAFILCVALASPAVTLVGCADHCLVAVDTLCQKVRSCGGTRFSLTLNNATIAGDHDDCAAQLTNACNSGRLEDTEDCELAAQRAACDPTTAETAFLIVPSECIAN